MFVFAGYLEESSRHHPGGKRQVVQAMAQVLSCLRPDAEDCWYYLEAALLEFEHHMMFLGGISI